MPYLIHVVNGQIVKQYELTDKLSIGRSEDNDIQIAGSTVSSLHAVVALSDGKAHIRDLDSTNGVKLNGKTVKEEELKVDDVITVGTHDFELINDPLDLMEKTTRIKKSWIPGVYYTTKD